MYCEPLRANIRNKELIKSFYIEREKECSDPQKVNGIIGLEAYLKYCAWDEDALHDIKVYVIKTYFTNEIVAYFALRGGMIMLDSDNRNAIKEEIAKKHGAKLVPQTIPGIEISHFAVNDNYRMKHGKNGKPLKGLGKAIYPDFIYPIINKISSLMGVRCAYLYAAGNQTLIDYYQTVFDFHANTDRDYVPIKPYYDNGCHFMYMLL